MRSLSSILAAMDKPVKSEVIVAIIDYMKAMPAEDEALVMECAEHLESMEKPSLGAVLAVAHALNGEAFLLKHRDEEDDPFGKLSKEFDEMLLKKDDAPALRADETEGQ